jgi:hypothetical protein
VNPLSDDHASLLNRRGPLPFTWHRRVYAGGTTPLAVDNLSQKTPPPSIRIASDFYTAPSTLSHRDIAFGSHQRWKDIGCRTHPNHPDRRPNETCRGT